MPDRDVERLLGEWLADEAPAHAPDRILAAANDRISLAGKRRGGRLAWLRGRPGQPAGAARALAAAAALLVVVSVALYAGSAPPVNITPTPTSSNVAVSATPTQRASARPSEAPAPERTPFPALADTRTIACGNVTVHDETELWVETGSVTGCTATEDLPDGVSIEDFVTTVHVANPDGDEHRLHVVWLASPCDTRAEMSIRAAAYSISTGDQTVPGYEVAVHRPDVYSGCRDEVVTKGVLIELSQPVPADVVTTSIGSANAADDVVSDLTLDDASYDPEATYRLGGLYAIDSAVTSTGQGQFCGIHLAAIDVGRRVDSGVLLLGFVGTAADPPWALNQRTTIIPAGTYRLRSPSDPPNADIYRAPLCEGWTIALHALTQSGRDDTDPTGATNFNLRIDAAQTEVAANEPIDVSATLAYQDRLGETIEVIGSGSGLIAFHVEQLDGDLEILQPSTADCERYSLTVGEPVTAPYTRSGRFEQPELRLTAGVWRVHARSEFAVGKCGAGQIVLTASITIRVR